MLGKSKVEKRTNFGIEADSVYLSETGMLLRYVGLKPDLLWYKNLPGLKICTLSELHFILVLSEGVAEGELHVNIPYGMLHFGIA